MYYLLAVLGVVMGVFGGLLGIGGSIIMIPALVFMFGENQHLYQAAAMICNFFVGSASVLVHKKANVLVVEVVKWLVAAAMVGILIGVAVSNSGLFAKEKSYLLARLFGLFAAYAAVYNCFRFKSSGRSGADGLGISHINKSVPLTIVIGLVTGLSAGLMGIGGGFICAPLQQWLLKMPLKRAISNSAATIASIALVGAFYKNMTLSQHNIELVDSVRIALCVIPGAIAGAFIGGRGMHKLPVHFVRIAFIVLAAVASIKLLTVAPVL